MKRTLTIILTLLTVFCSDIPANAESPRFVYGVEWGYYANLYEGHSSAYRNSVFPFYVIPEEGGGMSFFSGGFILAHAGLSFARHSSLALESGYCGVYRDRRFFPLLLSYTYAFSGHGVDGAICEIAAGPAIDDLGRDRVSFIGRIGAGYRVCLTDRFSIDFKGTIRACADHPALKDRNTSGTVPEASVLKSDSICCGLGLSVALNF